MKRKSEPPDVFTDFHGLKKHNRFWMLFLDYSFCSYLPELLPYNSVIAIRARTNSTILNVSNHDRYKLDPVVHEHGCFKRCGHSWLRLMISFLNVHPRNHFHMHPRYINLQIPNFVYVLIVCIHKWYRLWTEDWRIVMISTMIALNGSGTKNCAHSWGWNATLTIYFMKPVICVVGYSRRMKRPKCMPLLKIAFTMGGIFAFPHLI